MNANKSHSSGRVWLGIILISLGVLFILDNTGIVCFDFFDWIFRWPVILIIIGAIILINERISFAGILLVLIGGLFLFADIYNYSVGSIFRDYWPILLIILGFVILFKHKGTSYHRKHFSSGEGMKTDYIDIMAIFSGSRRVINSDNFKGGKSTAIFGGPEIDLRECKLAAGEQVLDIVAIFGGTEIYVPKDWQVIVKVVSIFGGFEDKRYRDPSTVLQEDRVLVIKGFVLFGGGDIKL